MNVPSVTTTPDLKVVLNGGSSQLASSTVPYRWFFSDTVIEKQPTHLLVIDQAGHEIGDQYRGDRRIIPVHRGSDFIQFDRHGGHRLTVLALKEKEVFSPKDEFDKFIVDVLRLEDRREYKHGINPEDIAEGIVCGRFPNRLRHVIAATTVDFEVPKELFATKSESRFGKIIWVWANVWCDTPPRDQCAYRRRVLLSIPKLLLYAVMTVIQYAAALFMTLLIPALRAGAFFFGYRPVSLFQDLGKIWSWHYTSDNMFEHDIRWFKIYRMWRRVHSDEGDAVYMPVTPFEAILAAGSAYIVSRGIHALLQHSDSKLLPGILGLCAVACLVTVWIMLKRIPVIHQYLDRRAEAERARIENEPIIYFEWLKRYTRIAAAPTKVDFDTLPEAFRGKLKQKMLIRFVALKTKVCRPYSR